MSTAKLNVLNRYHVIFLTHSVMIGTGILSLPQKLSSMGYSQWFMPLVFGGFATLTLWPMILLCSKYPHKNLFQINEILLGKVLGKSINILLTFQLIIFGSGIITDYMDLIQSTALQEQTITLSVVCFLFLLIYIVDGGLKSIARFCTITFFLTIGLFYFTRWAIEKGDISHFLPLFNFNKNEFFDAFKGGYFSFLGYELILFYFPYIISQKRAFRHSFIGIWISVLLCFITTTVSVMYFSEWQLENVEYSVLNLFKAGEFPFIERIDIIGITLWVFHILSAVAVYIWCAKLGAGTLLVKFRGKYLLYTIILIVFLLIIVPSREFHEKMYYTSNYTGYLVIILPVFLYIISLIRRKQEHV